jgi:hypothetical protein
LGASLQFPGILLCSRSPPYLHLGQAQKISVSFF